MAGRAIATVDTCGTLESLEIACAWRVDREYDGGTSGVFGARHQFFGDRPVVGGIELLPDRRAASGDDVFGRARCTRGQHHVRGTTASSARHTDLGVGVEGTHGRNCRKVNWAGPGDTVHRGRQTHLAHVIETASADFVVREGVVIADHGAIVVHAGGDVAVMRRRQRVARQRFEIHDVDGVVRGGDRRRGPGERARHSRRLFRQGTRQENRESAQSTEYRTSRQRRPFETFHSCYSLPRTWAGRNWLGAVYRETGRLISYRQMFTVAATLSDSIAPVPGIVNVRAWTDATRGRPRASLPNR